MRFIVGRFTPFFTKIEFLPNLLYYFISDITYKATYKKIFLKNLQKSLTLFLDRIIIKV